MGRQECFLGFEPRSLSRFWTDEPGNEEAVRVPVPEDSDEFRAVKGIFHAGPTGGSYYYPHKSNDYWDVCAIERIQNRSLHDRLDNDYSITKHSLQAAGSNFIGGVHTRWLFHGTGNKDALEMIVEDPQQGFNPLLNKRHLWGKG